MLLKEFCDEFLQVYTLMTLCFGFYGTFEDAKQEWQVYVQVVKQGKGWQIIDLIDEL